MTRSVFTDKYERFQQLLIDARKAADLTQTQLAGKLRQPQSYVSKYERGERRLDLIEFLEVAHVLGIDPADFIKQLHSEPPSRLPRKRS